MIPKKIQPLSLKSYRKEVNSLKRNNLWMLNDSDLATGKSHKNLSCFILPLISKILSNKIIDGDISKMTKQAEIVKQHKYLQGFEKQVKKHIIPIYRIDQKRHQRYINLKNNNELAFKEDFDLKVYQKNLVSEFLFIVISFNL